MTDVKNINHANRVWKNVLLAWKSYLLTYNILTSVDNWNKCTKKDIMHRARLYAMKVYGQFIVSKYWKKYCELLIISFDMDASL